jgi:hypothetical protein
LNVLKVLEVTVPGPCFDWRLSTHSGQSHSASEGRESDGIWT